ncbi:helix-turn-helix domain-containing protein [Desulfoluna sp.]|uniref:AlbA family DNA-binding domain-containing protein n=1 Tax=Desulfoluna sp. TaxID=2045199 RepID=UPI00260DE2D8|nr:ATP-binding protein [Desulfoluna sp.]
MSAYDNEILLLIQRGENLDLEFKSDARCLPDRELIAAVVSLANTDGGTLLLGVEDDGTVTGLHINHQNIAACLP